MTSKRKQTLMDTEFDHPVGMYKVIALTFLAITLVLFGAIIFLTSKRATIRITTKAEPVDVTTAITVNGEGTKSIAGAVRATAVTLSDSFEPTGTRKEPGIAKGTVTLKNISSVDQPLVATTRLLNPEGVLFRIKKRILVPANGTVLAEVYADQSGKSGNIGSSTFTIPGLNTARQKEVFATSDAPMEGGETSIGVLSSDDLDKAKKMLEDLALQAGQEALREDVSSGKAGVFKVTATRFEGEPVVGQEIGRFTLAISATIVGVFYDETELKERMQAALSQRAVEESEIVRPHDDPPRAELGVADVESGTAELQVFYSGLATLNPESKELASVVFYGKTKDEVRRYLLTLDHVFGVEIKLRPFWVQTVPRIADHVQVIVTEVD